MFVAAALEHITVPAVRVTSSTSLAETAMMMTAADTDTALVIDDDRCHGLVTAADLLRTLATAPTLEQGWRSEVTRALTSGTPQASGAERLSKVVELMGATNCDYLLLVTEQGPAVLSFVKMLKLDNGLLRRELDHLQTYIEALHDAPND
jgi:CBS domain-containing protein